MGTGRLAFAVVAAGVVLSGHAVAASGSGAPRVGLAHVDLPALADGWTRITDAASGMSVRFRTVGALPAPADVGSSTAGRPFSRVFSGALEGGTVLLRLVPGGVEDFVRVDPAARGGVRDGVVRYRIDVTAAAGVRWVAGVVEFVDAGGAPRLRVESPFVVAADGQSHPATTSLEGCAADTSAAAPWGRAVVPPGARECDLVVRWDAVRAGPGAMLDPAWTSTADLADPRHMHTATRLDDGRVLIVGGSMVNWRWITSCELFDPATSTWATTGPNIVAMAGHSATKLTDGRVVAVDEDRAEMYDPAAGTWTSLPDLPEVRVDHAAAPLPDGTVLVTGGDVSPNGPSASCLILDPAGGGTWTAAPSMREARDEHAATALGDGRVLVTGGRQFGVSSATAEVYDPARGVWASAGNLTDGRSSHFAGLLADGRVLLHGGIDLGDGGAEIWTPGTGRATPIATAAYRRYYHAGVTFSDGSALMIGSAPFDAETAELWSPTSDEWTLAPSMIESRSGHTATLLDDDGSTVRVLVAGGGDVDEQNAELFVAKLRGQACALDADCASGACIDGVCCDSRCDGICEACAARLTGGVDGVCGLALADTDPHSTCAVEAPTTCGSIGVCDGQGACRLHPAGVECRAGICVTSPATIDGYTYACDGRGACRGRQDDCCYDPQGGRVDYCVCNDGVCSYPSTGTGGLGGTGGAAGATSTGGWSGAGGSGGAGSGGGAGAGSGGSHVGPTNGGTSGGCACTTASRRGPDAWLMLAATGALGVARARRGGALARRGRPCA